MIGDLGLTDVEQYTAQYYAKLNPGTVRSAGVVVPLLVSLFSPKRVIDIGCGTGVWLAVMKRHGVDTVLGVDGPHIDPDNLQIQADEFIALDLSEPSVLCSAPTDFDLALALEVAEHIPEGQAARFIGGLATLAPVIAFSAAIPRQGGVGHVNEQWPDYWVKLFGSAGYSCLDCIRPQIWDRDDVDWWYAQNLLLFVRRDRAASHSKLQPFACTEGVPAHMVHPRNATTSWFLKAGEIREDLGETVPSGERFVLVDQDRLRSWLELHDALPFMERNGSFWGLPQNAGEAIRELRRLHAVGIRFLVIAFPAFWWYDRQQAFARFVQGASEEILANDRARVFHLHESI